MFLGLVILLKYAQSKTIVIPKTVKTHRLTLSDKSGKPKFINSAVFNNTLAEDKINMPREYSFLSTSMNSVCYEVGKDDLNVCQNDGVRLPYQIADVNREVRFATSDEKCLTIGKQNKETDEYEGILLPCDSKNMDQVFILNKPHGIVNESLKRTEMRKSIVKNSADPNIFGEEPTELAGSGNYDPDNKVEIDMNNLLKQKQNTGNSLNDPTTPVTVTYSGGNDGHLSRNKQ